jgi:hypothetical protein
MRVRSSVLSPRQYDRLADSLRARHDFDLHAEARREFYRRFFLRPRFYVPVLAVVFLALSFFTILFYWPVRDVAGWDCTDHCPPGAICDPGYVMGYYVRRPDGTSIGCDFDVVLPGEMPQRSENPSLDRFGRYGRELRADGMCAGGGGIGVLPLSTEFEIRAVGFEPFRFAVRDHCKRPYCGSCLDAEVTVTLKPTIELPATFEGTVGLEHAMP